METRSKYRRVSCSFFTLLVFIIAIIVTEITTAQNTTDQIRVTATDANIRNGPGTNYPVILTVSMDTVLPVVELQGNWYRVRLSPEYGTQENEGFIHNSIAEPVVRAPAVMQTEPEVEEVRRVRVTSGTANIRSGAGTNHPVIASVSSGAIFAVAEREGNWFEVQLSPEVGTEENYGFIHESSVEMYTAGASDAERQERTASSSETESRASDVQTGSPRDGSRYGLGIQGTFPAVGISGKMDIANELEAQAVLGFFSTLHAYAGRILYKFQQDDYWDMYGYGSVGVWSYRERYITGVRRSESTVGFGFGAGVQWDWRARNERLPPIEWNFEVGFTLFNWDEVDYRSSTIMFGVGGHYRF